ncbi:MAG: hypothetical protein ACRYFZ_21555 [Janthinobacterium lividum]
MLDALLNLQKDILRYENQEGHGYMVDYSPKLLFFQVGDLFDITLYSDGYDDDPGTKAVDMDYETNFAFCALLDLLSIQENANKLLAIEFTGQDEGANGIKGWVFDRIINSKVIFPNLKSFKVQLTDLGDHNLSIINGGNLEEKGAVAKLLAKMPVLETMVVPSAPDNSFFEIGEHPLSYLRVQTGINNQLFIDNLADSSNFANLKTIDYSELIDFENRIDEIDYTSISSFKHLFLSSAFASVGRFVLRNSRLEKNHLLELHELNKIQFLFIDAHGGYYINNLK